MVLVQKWPFFERFLSGNRGQENIVNDIVERKNAFRGYKKKKFKKSKNCHFSKGINPWFFSKNNHFSNFFFLVNIGQENIVNDILERKNAILGYKKKKFKKSKNCYFSKEVNPLFLSKNGHFLTFFFLGNIGQENSLNDIVERNNAFLRYKNKKFKKSKT